MKFLTRGNPLRLALQVLTRRFSVIRRFAYVVTKFVKLLLSRTNNLDTG